MKNIMKKYILFSFVSNRNKISYQLLVSLVFFMLATTNSWGQVLWSNPAGTDWLTPANWTGSSVPGSTDIAQFGVNPAGTAVGMSLSAATQQVGAIEMTSDRILPLTIGNSGTSLTGVLQLNGATVNGVTNTIIRNNSSSLLTIQNNAVTGTLCTLGIALTNPTNNIINADGTGGITITSVISGSSPLAKTGAGTLSVNAAASNTGLFTLNEGTLILGVANAISVNNTANASYLTMNGGTLELNGKGITGANRGATINGGSIKNSNSTACGIAGPVVIGGNCSIIGEAGLVNFASVTSQILNGTVTLGGAAGGSFTAGAASGSLSIIKNDAGTWTFNKNLLVTGTTNTTTINAGTLALNPNSNYTYNSAVILNGGTFSSAGFTATAPAVKTITCTSLQLQSSSTITLGSNSSNLNTIKFNDSHSIAWTNGATLTVTGWTGTQGNAGTVGRLFVLPNGTTNVGLTPSQLAQISFIGYANTSAMLTLGGEVIPITMPIVTAASSATVDAPFNITFGDQAAWRNAITGIKVDGNTLDPSAYNTSVAGKITFTPANSTLLQTAGTKHIVISAAGLIVGAVISPTFVDISVDQLIGAGAPAKLAINTQPTAPASNGVVLATQPVVAIQDQYGNATTSTANVVASVGAGTWTLGGTTTVAGVNGTSTFADLTATSTAAVSGATITFTWGSATITSGNFDIVAPTATAINSISDSELIQVYKNSTNQLIINCNADLKSDASVSVYNVVGKKLLSTRITNAVTILENSFQSGVYVVSVVNAGKTLTRMIVLN